MKAILFICGGFLWCTTLHAQLLTASYTVKKMKELDEFVFSTEYGKSTVRVKPLEKNVFEIFIQEEVFTLKRKEGIYLLYPQGKDGAVVAFNAEDGILKTLNGSFYASEKSPTLPDYQYTLNIPKTNEEAINCQIRFEKDEALYIFTVQAKAWDDSKLKAAAICLADMVREAKRHANTDPFGIYAPIVIYNSN